MEKTLMKSLLEIVKACLVVVISEERREQNLSQESLGFLSGIGRSNLTAIESQKRALGLDTLIKLFFALGLSIEVQGESKKWNINEIVAKVIKSSDLEQQVRLSEELVQYFKLDGVNQISLEDSFQLMSRVNKDVIMGNTNQAENNPDLVQS